MCIFWSYHYCNNCYKKKPQSARPRRAKDRGWVTGAGRYRAVKINVVSQDADTSQAAAWRPGTQGLMVSIKDTIKDSFLSLSNVSNQLSLL